MTIPFDWYRKEWDNFPMEAMWRTIMPEFDGYEEASKIDKVINSMLQQNEVTNENWLEWLKFSRTLSTSCEIIEAMAWEKKTISSS